MITPRDKMNAANLAIRQNEEIVRWYTAKLDSQDRLRALLVAKVVDAQTALDDFDAAILRAPEVVATARRRLAELCTQKQQIVATPKAERLANIMRQIEALQAEMASESV